MVRSLAWILVFVSSLAAGPFEPVASDDAARRDLDILHQAGLDRSTLVRYEPGSELHRYEATFLWKSAYQELRDQVARFGRPVATPDRRVERVAAAMLQLLQVFRDEIATTGIDADLAKIFLTELPGRLPAIGAGAPRSVASGSLAPVGGQPPSSVFAASSGLFGEAGVALTGSRSQLELARTGGTGLFGGEYGADFDARLSAELFGISDVGLSLRELKVVERDRFGPSRLMVGRQLAADLRLRMGDASVVLEYANSLVETYLGASTEDSGGEAFRARLQQQINDDLSLDLGYRRISSGYSLLDAFRPGDTVPDLSGFEAGLTWGGRGFGVASHAAIYTPEGQSVGYLGQIGTEMHYSPADQWQLSLVYQLSARRRLATIDDYWKRILNTRVVYDINQRFRADLSYRFESGESVLGLGPDDEHIFGASLGVGF